jgi:hypothetical protein
VKHRTYLQWRAESGLADHPYHVELVGGMDKLEWPPICANCGIDTHDRLTVRKVFGRPRRNLRHTGSYQRQVIRAAQIPYCGTCVAKHRALMVPRSWIADLWHMLWPVLIPMAGAGWFFVLTFRMALGIPSTERYSRYAWGLPALFGGIILWCLVIAWYSSRALRVERQSEVTLACDFSDDVSWLWEHERRIYALRNERFAHAFGGVNAARVWGADNDLRSWRIRSATLGLAAVVLVAVWAVVVLAPR